MKKSIYILIAISYFFASCNDLVKTNIKTKGMRPIYVNESVSKTITNTSVQPMLNTGKIMIWNQYILVNEYNKGIHIVNNIDKTNPQKVGFISIPFNKDMSIKNNKLYVDNGKDLVVLEASDIMNVSVVSRVADMFSKISDDFPPAYNGYFECVDPSKGLVIGWEEVSLENPECKTF